MDKSYCILSIGFRQAILSFETLCVNVKCYCITFSKKFELTENTYDVNVFMLVCILLYVGTLNFIVRQLNL